MFEFILTRVVDFTKEFRPVKTEYADAELTRMINTRRIAIFDFFRHLKDVKTALLDKVSVTVILTRQNLSRSIQSLLFQKLKTGRLSSTSAVRADCRQLAIWRKWSSWSDTQLVQPLAVLRIRTTQQRWRGTHFGWLSIWFRFSLWVSVKNHK